MKSIPLILSTILSRDSSKNLVYLINTFCYIIYYELEYVYSNILTNTIGKHFIKCQKLIIIGT